MTLLEYWSIQNPKKEHGAMKFEKGHGIDNPGEWQNWKKEQGAKKNEKGAEKKGKMSKGEKVKGIGSKRLISERSREQGPPLQRLTTVDFFHISHSPALRGSKCKGSWLWISCNTFVQIIPIIV